MARKNESEAKRRPAKRRRFSGLKERRQKIDGITFHIARLDGRLERLCVHGVGHTVGVIDPTPAKLADPSLWVHGCDGCCASYVRMSPNNYPMKGKTGRIL